MKTKLLLCIAALSAWACSTPRYSYYFDHYDYGSGKKNAAPVSASVSTDISSPLILAGQQAEASTAPVPVAVENTQVRDNVVKALQTMSKEEKRELRREIKAELRKSVKKDNKPDNISASASAKAMDHDLKLAAIFGAVGLVLTLFGGVSSVFWVLGVIAFVIGIVFLIKWLARQ